jgi:hypothetical protein
MHADLLATAPGDVAEADRFGGAPERSLAPA